MVPVRAEYPPVFADGKSWYVLDVRATTNPAAGASKDVTLWGAQSDRRVFLTGLMISTSHSCIQKADVFNLSNGLEVNKWRFYYDTVGKPPLGRRKYYIVHPGNSLVIRVFNDDEATRWFEIFATWIVVYV